MQFVGVLVLAVRFVFAGRGIGGHDSLCVLSTAAISGNSGGSGGGRMIGLF